MDECSVVVSVLDIWMAKVRRESGRQGFYGVMVASARSSPHLPRNGHDDIIYRMIQFGALGFRPHPKLVFSVSKNNYNVKSKPELMAKRLTNDWVFLQGQNRE